MSVYQRSDGRWVVKTKDEAEARWRQRTFKTEAEAREYAGEIQYDCPENERLTLEECVIGYLQATPMCEKGVRDYQSLFNGTTDRKGHHTAGAAEHLRNKFVDSLTKRDLESVRDVLRGRGVSNSTINLHTCRLQAAFNWAAREDLIEKNPWKKYGQIRRVEKKSRAGNPDDFWKIYQELPAWLQWAMRTALALCLRPGIAELFRLKWDAFDWSAGLVAVYMPKVGRSKTVCPPQWYMEEAYPRCRADKDAGQVYVCRNSYDKPVHGYHVQWGMAVRRAGVPHMPPYAVRHIAASMMLAAGADIASVAAQLGHKNVTTTGAFYTHAMMTGQQQAAGKLALPGPGTRTVLPAPEQVQNGAAVEKKDK